MNIVNYIRHSIAISLEDAQNMVKKMKLNMAMEEYMEIKSKIIFHLPQTKALQPEM